MVVQFLKKWLKRFKKQPVISHEALKATAERIHGITPQQQFNRGCE